MNIPKNYLTVKKWERIYNAWYVAAEALSLETGIFVTVQAEYRGEGAENFQKASRLYFKLDDHEFDSMHDLKKAIENKAFL